MKDFLPKKQFESMQADSYESWALQIIGATAQNNGLQMLNREQTSGKIQRR